MRCRIPRTALDLHPLDIPNRLEHYGMRRNMRVGLAMAVLIAELLLLAVIGPGRIDQALSCTFLSKPELQADRPPNAEAFQDRNEQQQQQSPQQCKKNRRIFVYDLPARFNADLLRSCDTLNPWKSMCSAVSNGGLGPLLLQDSSSNWLKLLFGRISRFFSSESEDYRNWPARSSWHATDQFSGEIIVHNRMLDYGCRTQDPDQAAAFFIPFYAGLDVSRYLWSSTSSAIFSSPNESSVDSLGQDLLHWLEKQPHFLRNQGADHFLMAGRISWDFRRLPHAIQDWGSSLFHRSQMKNITRLVIERSPWDESDVGVPYPTAFHPASDSDLQQWLQFVRSNPRANLFAFAGSPRPGYRNDFRQLLFDQCRAVERQKPRDGENHRAACLDCARDTAGCSKDPLRVTRVFLSSVFCLQPRGDSFTRKSIFDSLIAGCIPVFFWNQSAYWQYQMYLPRDPESYSIFIPHQSLRNGTKVLDVLKRVSERSVARLQREVQRILPGLLYASSASSSPSSRRQWDDALDIAIEGVLSRINAMKRA